MNFQNLPAQVIILLVGWAFTLMLDRKSKHRIEAIKRKDTIVSRIEDLADWIDKEVTKTQFDAVRLEASLAGNLTQTELKMVQLNLHLKKNLLDPTKISVIRDIDISGAKLIHELSFSVRQASADVIEYIEKESNNYFFQENKLLTPTHFANLGAVLFGILMTLSIMIIVETINGRATFSTPINNFFNSNKNQPPQTSYLHILNYSARDN